MMRAAVAGEPNGTPPEMGRLAMRPARGPDQPVVVAGAEILARRRKAQRRPLPGEVLGRRHLFVVIVMNPGSYEATRGKPPSQWELLLDPRRSERRLAEWDDAVRAADIVFGMDTQRRDKDAVGTIRYGPPGSAPERETIFYGRSLLALIAGGDEGAGLEARVVRVPIDWNADDPEELATMCRELKGACDLE